MRRRDDLLDWAAALLLTALAVLEQRSCECGGAAVNLGRAADAVNLGLVVLTTLPLGLRRRAPFVVFLVCGAGALLHLKLGFENHYTITFAVLFALYTVAANAEWLYSVAAAVITALVLPVSLAVDWTNRGHVNLADVPYNYLLFGVSWILGDNVRKRRELNLQLEARAARIEADQAERERQAVGEERARIARELHDLVAHSLSVIVLQAGAARRLAAAQPARAGPALDAIEGVAREALAEMRRLVGILRKDARAEEVLEPQPSLSRMTELIDRLRAAGLDVTVRSEGEPRPLPPGVDLSAFRIVQEALTNTLRHSAAGHADVRLRYLEDSLEVLVQDDGAAADGGEPPAGGHGLVGMRERVAMFGGEFEAAPTSGGGFRVSATIPLEPVIA